MIGMICELKECFVSIDGVFCVSSRRILMTDKAAFLRTLSSYFVIDECMFREHIRVFVQAKDALYKALSVCFVNINDAIERDNWRLRTMRACFVIIQGGLCVRYQDVFVSSNGAFGAR